MPVSTIATQHPLGLTGRVFVFTCDHPGCTAEACYGFGGSLRAAIATKDPSKAGEWFCREHMAEAQARLSAQAFSVASSPDAATSSVATEPKLL